MTLQAADFLVAKYLRDQVLADDLDLVEIAQPADPNIWRQTFGIQLTGTGLRGILVTSGAGGTATNSYGAYSQSVNVRCYADHTRNANKLSATDDGQDRAWMMRGKVDQLLNRATPLLTDPLVQCDRQGPPLPSYDASVDLPFVSCNYDIAILQSPS